jgi:very-short-patch-repair endonuclease
MPSTGPAHAHEPQCTPDKPRVPLEVCPTSTENRSISNNPALAGSLCSFELVRGTGDSEVIRLAEIQHGRIHLRQLRAAGIGPNALAHRVRTGWLRRVLPSVYATRRAETEFLGRAMAAVLHFKGDALASGLCAAELWGFLDTTQRSDRNSPIDVLLAGRNATPVAGVRIHRVKTIAHRDVRWRHGIPVTSPARACLDLAAIFDDFELEAALAAAFRRNAVRPSQLEDVMDRNPYAKGVGRLRALLDYAERPHDTRSDYERRLLALIRAAELPLPLTNAHIGEHMVDMLWPDLKLVVEFDSWAFHRDRSSFEKDRLRDQVLSVSGHHVMRVTARQVDHTPIALVARIAAIVTARQLSR